LQCHQLIVAVAAAEELHQLDREIGALAQARGFEQRLLGRRIERRNLRDAVDQRLVVEARDRGPVDDIALALRKAPRLAFERGALDRGEFADVGIKRLDVGLDDTIGRVAGDFVRQAEARFAGQDDVESAISERLAERPELEIVMIQPKTADGWIEQMAMDGTRVRLTQMIGKNDPTNRFRIYYPVTDGGTPIYVHAKVMIVDDAMLRIGSSNLNNRSLGLDSECDLLFEVVQAEDPGKTRTAIRQIREGLLAEHLGCSASEWCDAAQAAGSINGAIEALQGSGKTVELLPMEEPEGFEEFIADKQLLDPECADEFFEPFQKTSLVSSFVANLRGRAKRFRR